MITLEQAKSLKPGDILYEIGMFNADGTSRRWRVNGKPKQWVRAPERVSIPVKHGLYWYGYVTETDLHTVSLVENEANVTLN